MTPTAVHGARQYQGRRAALVSIEFTYMSRADRDLRLRRYTVAEHWPMTGPFIQIKCPACGSTQVDVVRAGNYQCDHCDTHFVFKVPRPVPPTPKRRPTPVSYGPSPYVQQPQVHAAPSGSPVARVMAVLFMMVLLGVGGVVFLLLGVDSQAPTSSTSSAKPPKKLTQAPAVQSAKTPTTRVGKEPAPDSPDTAAGTPLDTKEKPAPTQASVDIQDYQGLSGCGCKTDTDGDGRRDQVDLYLRASSATTITAAGTERFVNTEFAVAGEGVKPFGLPVTDATAPADRYPAGRFALGVGCDGDRLIIAALGSVSAWSLADQTLLWTQTLEKPFSRFAEGKASVDCRSLPISAGTVRVRTEGGTQSLRVETGEEPTASPRRKPVPNSNESKPKPEPKSEPKPEPKPDPKPEPKSDPKPEPKSDPKPEPKSDPTPTPAPTKKGKGAKKKKKKKKKKKGGKGSN